MEGKFVKIGDLLKITLCLIKRSECRDEAYTGFVVWRIVANRHNRHPF